MAETKRLPGISWAYDQWKKLGKARLAGALVLGGLGVTAMLTGGGILGIGAGAVAGGIFVGRKIMTLGGLSTGFGTYEMLTKFSYGGIFGKGGEAPKIPLSNNRATELAEWDKTYRKTNRVPGGAALFLRYDNTLRETEASLCSISSRTSSFRDKIK